MTRRILAFALAFAAATLAGPALADTVAEKPRLTVLVDGANPNFLRTLTNKLVETRRFNMVDRPNLRSRLRGEQIELGAGITVQQSRRALAVGEADMVLEAEVKQNSGSLRIQTRLYDFRSGEFSRDLSLLGSSSDAETLADQLARFVRSSVPIRCLVKDMAEDQVILDLGAMDGVQVGSFYRVFRHPQNMKPVEIGLIRVSAVEPFAAVAEVEETAKGFTLQPGDMLRERTSGLLVSMP